MPSSPGYKRDYKHEYAIEDKKRRLERAARNHARRLMAKVLGHPVPHGEDVDHKKPLSKGGSTKQSNLRLESAHKNRSYPRNSDGSMK